MKPCEFSVHSREFVLILDSAGKHEFETSQIFLQLRASYTKRQKVRRHWFQIYGALAHGTSTQQISACTF